MRNKIPTALYIHWPFCKAKCPYCDFNSHVREQIDEQAWQRAYLAEIARAKDSSDGAYITSIFFGGGTPSLMSPALVEAILGAVHEHFTLSNDCEITLEANPTSVEAAKLQGFRSAGVNRLSMGVQSFKAQDLQFLGRTHSADEAQKAIATAAAIFSNFSFDLIYARPGQTVAAWEEELSQALALGTQHLSLYQLTIEKGTPFYTAYNNKQFRLPGEALAADLYLATEAVAAQHGLLAYEVSNYARPGFESRHNLAYWRYMPYIGIGPGAHGRVLKPDGTRRATYCLPHPERWLETAQSGQTLLEDTALTREDITREFFLMRLRLREAITDAECQKVLGVSLKECINAKALETALQHGLVMGKPDSFAPTTKGWLVLNALIEKLCKL